MDITIRKAGPDDLESVLQIGLSTFIETFADHNSPQNMELYLATAFQPGKIAAELSDPDSTYYLAMDGEQTIGFLKINVGDAQTELRQENTLEIERIYVRKSHKGRSVGKMLMDIAIGTARDRRSAYVWLGVWEKNEPAIRFYEKLGFTVFDKHLFRLGDDIQTDLMMKLDPA